MAYMDPLTAAIAAGTTFRFISTLDDQPPLQKTQEAISYILYQRDQIKNANSKSGSTKRNPSRAKGPHQEETEHRTEAEEEGGEEEEVKEEETTTTPHPKMPEEKTTAEGGLGGEEDKTPPIQKEENRDYSIQNNL